MQSFKRLTELSFSQPRLDRPVDWIYARAGHALEHFQRARRLNPECHTFLLFDQFPTTLAAASERHERERWGVDSDLFPSNEPFVLFRERQELAMADVVMVFGDVALGLLRQEYPERTVIRLSPIGPRHEITRKKLALPLRFLFWADAPFRQGFPDLIAAWDHAALPDALLVCLLGTKMPLASKQLLKYIVRNPSIEILNLTELSDQGIVPDTFFASSGVMVHPAIEDVYFLPAARAIGMGLPLVISDNTDLRPLVVEGKNGFICRAGSEKSVADALRSVYSQRHSLAEFGRANSAVAAAFAPEVAAQELVTIIGETLQSRPHTR
jgi:glycosyltransferase involved in cell wall biosynthesis